MKMFFYNMGYYYKIALFFLLRKNNQPKLKSTFRVTLLLAKIIIILVYSKLKRNFSRKIRQISF